MFLILWISWLRISDSIDDSSFFFCLVAKWLPLSWLLTYIGRRPMLVTSTTGTLHKLSVFFYTIWSFFSCLLLINLLMASPYSQYLLHDKTFSRNKCCFAYFAHEESKDGFDPTWLNCFTLLNDYCSMYNLYRWSTILKGFNRHLAIFWQ